MVEGSSVRTVVMVQLTDAVTSHDFTMSRDTRHVFFQLSLELTGGTSFGGLLGPLRNVVMVQQSYLEREWWRDSRYGKAELSLDCYNDLTVLIPPCASPCLRAGCRVRLYCFGTKWEDGCHYRYV